jgi:hypothetical protein
MTIKRSSEPASALDLIGTMFIGLKLTKLIDWDWYSVLAPLWIPFLLQCTASLTVLIVLLVRNRRPARNRRR